MTAHKKSSMTQFGKISDQVLIGIVQSIEAAVQSIGGAVFQVNGVLVPPGFMAAFNQARPEKSAQPGDGHVSKAGAVGQAEHPTLVDQLKSRRRPLYDGN